MRSAHQVEFVAMQASQPRRRAARKFTCGIEAVAMRHGRVPSTEFESLCRYTGNGMPPETESACACESVCNAWPNARMHTESRIGVRKNCSVQDVPAGRIPLHCCGTDLSLRLLEAVVFDRQQWRWLAPEQPSDVAGFEQAGDRSAAGYVQDCPGKQRRRWTDVHLGRCLDG